MRSKLLLLFFAFTTLLTAQENYQYVFQQKHGRVNDLAISDGRVVAGGSEEACANPMIALMNRDGSLAWEVTPYECGYCRVNDVEFAGNGDILLGGIFKEANDVGTFVDGLAVARFDTFGNRLAFQHMYWYPFFDPVSILELPNGNIVAGGNKYLFGFNSELDSLFTRIYDFTSGGALITIKMLNDSSLVLPTKGSILFTDLQGQIQQEIPAPPGGDLVDLEVWGDSLLLMNSGALYFYDVATADLSSVNLPQTGRKGIILHQDTIMVWGEAVHRLADNGEWQLVTAPDNNEKSNLTVGYDQGIVYRAGTKYLEPDLGQPSYIRLFQDGFLERITTLANPPPPVKDLGLTGVYNVELISHTPYEDGPGFFANKYRIKFGLEVMNFGDLPVQSCVVGSEVLGSHNCSEGRFFAIDSMMILPGESIIVEGETTEIRYSDSPNPTVTFERCFFVGAPDHEFDLNFDNNYNCGVIFVDTKDLEDNLNLQLYPNPATDLLQVVVNPQHPIKTYTWINAAGQVISSQKVAPTSEMELTRPGPAGLYFLKVMSDQGSTVQRVIWK